MRNSWVAQLVESSITGRRDARSPRERLADVEDFLQRVDVRIDEQASVDFNRGISAEMERIGAIRVWLNELVVNMKLAQKTGD
jgi:hypothetical protein